MAIDEPTDLQRNFIPPILDGKDVLIRDTTGSGKTFGVLLSLLTKPRRRISPGNQPGITSVVVVPNRELAFQIQSWARSLFPSLTDQQFEEIIQVLITPDPPLLSQLITADDIQDDGKRQERLFRIGEMTDSKPVTSMQSLLLETDEQVKRLGRTLPHVLVATPTRLWSLMERGILDLSGIETLVLDEVDHLVRLSRRFASQREISNRDKHPKPGELALREIMRSAQAAGRYGQENIKNASGSVEKESSMTTTKSAPLDRIQVVASSATMNRQIRYWLESNGWIRDPEWVDTTKSVVLPKEIEHHCVVVGGGTVRNMRLTSDNAPWSQASSRREDSDKEVDWAETDKAWSEDKNAAWKDRQLMASSASETETSVEKFADDDDRMLEGVAMACLLDNVVSACVFFCSPFSLGYIAQRFESEFQLNTHQLQNVFTDPQSSNQQDQLQGRPSGLTAQPKQGIYIAHESNARGLDLPGLSHVFIVGLPSSPSSYVHMAGRTGRMGQKGRVVTIIRDDGHLEDRARSLFKTLQVDVQPFKHVQ
ncbi:hypothetical protein BGX31_004427 [Mortierella sp. GBA43]|nr:hypothetical protein BGX31_004427 [Mortierella sp. GBA43]